jgi:hypothetical protein
MYNKVLRQLLTLSLVALLSCSATGCASRTARTDLLPPETDHPRDYETVEVLPSNDTTSATSHTLYSRPLNYRSANAASTAWCSIDPSVGTLQTGRAHGGEYHAGWAYFMPTPSYTNNGRTHIPTPLYACDATGKVTKIIDLSEVPAVDMYDFSVSPDGRYVILYGLNKYDEVSTLCLWSVERAALVGQAFMTAEDDSSTRTAGRTAENPVLWDIPSGNSNWHEVAATDSKPAHYEFIATANKYALPGNVQFYGIIQFDGTAPEKASMTRYPVPAGVSFAAESLQMIDPATDTVAYDDYPMFIEYGDELFKFDRAQTPTHMFLYDIKTGKNTSIAKLPACQFLPQWVGAATLEYNVASDPKVRPAIPKQADPRTFVTKTYPGLLARGGQN